MCCNEKLTEKLDMNEKKSRSDRIKEKLWYYRYVIIEVAATAVVIGCYVVAYRVTKKRSAEIADTAQELIDAGYLLLPDGRGGFLVLQPKE